MISQNLSKIASRVKEAAQRAGRSPNEITLIAVSKSQPIEKITEAVAAGQKDFGENYAQEFLEHACPPLEKGGWGDLRWHFIGHLQRNKVKSILPHVGLIHSVDSQKLADEIEKHAALLGKTQDILIEIHLGNEASKTGLPPNEVGTLVSHIHTLAHVRLKGFMTIPPPSEKPEGSRAYFMELRKIRDAINEKKLYKHPLEELSMGMSHDFEVAIEEGSTLIRVGTAIFGERNAKKN